VQYSRRYTVGISAAARLSNKAGLFNKESHLAIAISIVSTPVYFLFYLPLPLFYFLINSVDNRRVDEEENVNVTELCRYLLQNMPILS